MIVAVVSMIAIAVTVMAVAFLMTRRSRPTAPDLSHLDDRLLRIEQAMDSVAVEVERISEAQRFATKLLSERERVPLASERKTPDRG